MTKLTLLVECDGDLVRLTSPGVGLLTCVEQPGRALIEGQSAGTLLVLGCAYELIVPEGVAGVITSSRPEQVHAAVAFGTTLYELAPLHSSAATRVVDAAQSRSSGSALHFAAPQTGRFWHRTAPGEPALAGVGSVLESGTALGVIEVMKTFTLVSYGASASLPPRARVVRVLAADGAEVAERAPLFEIEPA